MRIFKTTVLAGAVLTALSSNPVLAAESPELKGLKATVEDLKRQIQSLKAPQGNNQDALTQARVEELRKQVQDLRNQLKKKEDEANGAPAAEGESQEAIDARTAATKADIQGLRTDIENYKYDQSRLQERNIPSVTRNTKIGGSLTLGYQQSKPDLVPTAQNSGTTSTSTGPAQNRGSTFTAPSFGLNFSGNLYRDYAEGRNLTYRLALSGSSSNGSSSISATDAYIRYSFQPASGNPEDPLGTITLGQQTVPFGQDAQALDPEVKAIINNAGFVSGLGLNSRQVGVVLSGDYDPYVDFTNNYRAPLVSYSLGLFNGNGANRTDNNGFRDIVGRLVYTLPVDYSSWLRQLQVGASYYRGWDVIGPSSDKGLTAGKKGLNTRQGFDINWTHLPYSISYEWAYGKKRVYTATPDPKYPDGFQRGVGQYINFGYTWGEQFLNSSKQQGKFDDYWPKSYQAFLRFDSWNANRSKAGEAHAASIDKNFTTTYGLNVFFAETTKFQINYVHVNYDRAGAAETLAKPKSSNGWLAQFNATF